VRQPWLFAAIALAAVATAQSARAQSYSELAPQGYILFKRTHVVGVFEGCERNRDISFADGTIFFCHESNHHTAYQPPVVILKNGSANSYAVLIDGRAYKGGIRQLEGKVLARPLPADDVHGGPADPILGADALPLPGVPQFAKTMDAVKPETLAPNIPLAPGTQGGPPPDPRRKLNQNYP
jgi:hypothetical protein